MSRVAHPGQAHDGRVGDDAHHGVAGVAAGLEIGEDRADVFLEEQQGSR